MTLKTAIFDRIRPPHTKRLDNGCIEFKPHLKHAYGLISITLNGKRKSVPAHRAVYMATHDCMDLARDIIIRHTCDNPRCVNIEHLVPGSYKDNMGDCIQRGRRAETYVYHNRVRVHSDDLIRSIRNATGKHRCIALAHGVSIGYVSRIKSGKAKRLV